MNGNNDVRRTELSSSIISRHRTGESPTSLSSSSSSSTSSSPAVLLSTSLGNGICSSTKNRTHQRTTSHDSTASSVPSSGLNSFLKWFRKSPVPGDRPHSQPPPTPPRQRIVSVTTSAPPAAAALVVVPCPDGDNYQHHHHLSTESLPNQPASAAGAGADLFASCTPETLSAASSVSPSLSLSSLSSRGSVYSTATNGFAFIPPEEYAPYGAAFQPEKRIAVGPVTDTYRQRLNAHQHAKETDRRLDQRLSQKYNLFESDTVSTADDLTLTRPRPSDERAELANRVSLPVAIVLPSQSQQKPQPTLSASVHQASSPVDRRERRSSLHRRTCSESSKDRRAGAYVHVKGKRKAPEPPSANGPNGLRQKAANNCLTPPVMLSPMSTLARRKRQAPAPPASPTPVCAPAAVSPLSALPSPNNGDAVRLFNDDEIQAIMAGHSAAVLSAMERSSVSPNTLSATDTLKLEHGLLKHTDNVSMSPPTSSCSQVSGGVPLAMVDAATSPLSPISPRPWYKRSSANNSRDREAIPFKREIALKTMEKRKVKTKAGNRDVDASKLPDIGYSRGSSLFDGFFARVSKQSSSAVSADSSSGAAEKRRSAIGMPNISELDREAAEIIRMGEETTAQQLAASAAAQMHDKYFEFPVDDEAAVVLTDASCAASQHRSSTKQLISRFEETNSIRSTANVDTAIINKYFADATAPTASVARTTPAAAPASVSVSAAPINVGDSSSSRSRSSSSTGSTNAGAGAVTRNRALSPSTPACVPNAAAASAASPTPPTPPTSMMQRIFSTNASGHNRAANAVEPSSSALQRSNAKNTTPISGVASTSTSTANATDTNNSITSTRATNAVITTAGSPDIPSSAAATWICAYCTLENYNWRVICEVCERMRPFPKQPPQATVGPTGDLLPVPRFRYTGDKRTDDVAGVAEGVVTTAHSNPVTTATAVRTASSHKACLIDSSAVLVTTTPQVFIAPFPAKHEQMRTTDANRPAIVTQSVPNLDAIRAARIEKFSHETTSQSTKNIQQSSAPLAQPIVVANDKQPLLTDRGSLEREKQRLREMIREMNAKALAEKYPVRSRQSESPDRRPAEVHSVQSQTTLTTSTPIRIPVGRGALRKIPQQRKIESPEDKIISDTANYICDAAPEKATDTKASQAAFGTSPPVPGPPQRPQTLLNLPSPIAELSIEETLLASNSGPNSPTTQQRLVDEQIDSIYAKLKSNNSGRNGQSATADSQLTIARGLDDFKAATLTRIGRRPTDTLALNKLLKNLELAIGEGAHERAATLAMDLARMKVSLTVTKQQTPAAKEADGKISNVSTDVVNEDEGATALPPPSLNGHDVRNMEIVNGWTCPLCTLINDSDRTGCTVCSETRPATFQPLVVNTNVTSDAQPQVKLRETTNTNANSNDLNKTSINRRSAEMFNIIIGPANETNHKVQAKPSAKPTNAPAEPKPLKKTLIAAAAIMPPSPNITRTKYRGVDNYNPQVNKQVVVPAIQTPHIRKSTTPYKSPLARTNGGVKITAVTLKTGENIQVSIDGRAFNQIRSTAVVTDTNTRGGAGTTAIGATTTAISTYNELLNLDNCSLVPNTKPFECAVCLRDIASEAGVVLRDCLHQFCRECLAQIVRYSEEAEVRCPYRDMAYSCDSCIQEREIRGLLSREEYERHLAVSLSVAELRETNAFHCKTPGCRGWCIYEDNVNVFRCPICKITNCLTCRVVHDGLNCKQYQDRMNSDSDCNEEARRTSDMLNDMIEKGEAMKCPICQVILMKKWGCDWLKCSMCKTEICWVTRGIRWGPEGKGDTSAGCRCGVNGVKCHPKCNYCH